MAKELQRAGHRTRLSTHQQFEGFVRGEGVEFYPMAGAEGDWTPSDLMKFMEEGRSLQLRDLIRLRPSEMMKRTRATRTIFLPTQPPGHDDGENPHYGSWAAAFQPDLSSGLPFRAQALISNPPSYTHIHIAERLRIPCQLVFTMPWTQTQAVGHPIASRPESSPYWNEFSFRWVEQVQWQS